MLGFVPLATMGVQKLRGLGTSCFVEGTDVLVGSAGGGAGAFSTKDIEDVEVGDLVWSRGEGDPDGAMELRRVTSVFRRVAYDLQTLSLRDESGNVEVLKV